MAGGQRGTQGEEIGPRFPLESQGRVGFPAKPETQVPLTTVLPDALGHSAFPSAVAGQVTTKACWQGLATSAHVPLAWQYRVGLPEKPPGQVPVWVVKGAVAGQEMRLFSSEGHMISEQPPTIVEFQVPNKQPLRGEPENPLGQIPVATESPGVAGQVMPLRTWLAQG